MQHDLIGLKAVAFAALALIVATSAKHARAEEVDSFCALSRAQAEVSSALLAQPEVFGNVGDSVTAQKSMTVGVRNSVARTRRAGLTDELAQAECAAYRAERALSQQVQGVEARAELLSLIAAEPHWRKALELAKANLKREEALVKAQQGTLPNLKEAFDQLDLVRREMAASAARKARLEEVLPDADAPLAPMLDEAIAARSHVAHVGARLNQANAWDVTYAAGMRTDLSSHEKKGFVALTAAWSFGQSKSDAAAARVAGLTGKWMREKQDGEFQIYLRALDSLRAQAAAQQLMLDGFAQRTELIRSAQARIQGTGTASALRMQRAMVIESVVIAAQEAAARVRMNYLKDWIARNAT